MKYQSQFKEKSESLKEYVDFFQYALSELENMLGASLKDDKALSKMKTNIVVQKYKRELNYNYFSIAKRSVIDKLKHLAQQGVLTRGFVNKHIKALNDASGNLNNNSYTEELAILKNISLFTLQKLKKAHTT